MILNAVALVVTTVWVVNFGATVLVKDFDGSAVNTIFPVIMGSILAIKGRRSRGSDEEPPSPPSGGVE